MSDIKILYLMMVDWDWIKQRPHFLAEHLSQRFHVTITYPFARCRKRMKKNPRQGLRLIPMLSIPFKYEYPLLYRLNRLYQRILMRVLIATVNPDVIWLTHPFQYDLLPRYLKCRIVYDCMDDAQALTIGKAFAKRLALKLEQKLIRRCDLAFVSSEHLADVLDQREPCAEKTILVRNAYDGKLCAAISSAASTNSRLYKIAYVGTVASWMDFDAIMHSLERIKDIEFIIIGPHDFHINIPEHDRLKILGPVPHADLQSAIRDCDCLIMPFKVNDVVKSVDPVKLYEYINFNKPIISVYYDEISRFAPFAEFYSDKDELVSVLSELKRSGWRPKYSEETRYSFLVENTWEVRSRKVVECLERLFEQSLCHNPQLERLAGHHRVPGKPF